MAQAVPNVYLASVRERSKTTDDEFYKLPQNHVDDLRDVARGVEETNAGVCCRYLVDQLTSSRGSDVDDDGYIHQLEAVERFCDRYGVFKHPAVKTWRNRVKRCRRTLARMRSEQHVTHAAVLHVAFGYPDPITQQLADLSTLGDFASLARYTQPVEDRRKEMVRAEAARSAHSPYVRRLERGEGTFIPFSEIVAAMCESEEAFRLATKYAKPGTQKRETLTREEGAALFDLERHRGLVAHADRCISSSDALRTALTPSPRLPRESEEHYRERRVRDKSTRASFLVDVKLAAVRMLSDATRVYHATWFRCAV